MGRHRIQKWKFKKLIQTIVASLLNKYDFFMVIEGGTGIGKSTLAYHIGHKVALEFKRLYRLDPDAVEYYYERVGRKTGFSEEEFIDKILKLKENEAYKFSPRKCLIYSQDDMQKSLTSWNSISIPDELINMTFNRDFYSEKQKDIIKIINMFRDHENLTISCVPAFQNIDTQIKNLTKMKITVKKRGIAIIHTPNNVIYCRDKWDSATNEKIERDWIMKKLVRPNYSQLTTFRGLVKFPPLTKAQEKAYQQVKDNKRTVVLKEDMGIDVDEKEKFDPFADLMERLINGAIKSGEYLKGYADTQGMSIDTLNGRIKRELDKRKKNNMISSYYYNKKAKQDADDVDDTGN